MNCANFLYFMKSLPSGAIPPHTHCAAILGWPSDAMSFACLEVKNLLPFKQAFGRARGHSAAYPDSGVMAWALLENVINRQAL